jgi:tetratricopeptide (TPR) repeat protein
MERNLKEKFSEIADEFQIGILEAALKGDEDNFNVLFELGNTYTRVGRYEDGLRIDLKLTRLRPEDPVVHYNLACSLSLLSRIDESFEALKTSFDLGYHDYSHLLSDPDLENVRRDDRFTRLVERLRQQP